MAAQRTSVPLYGVGVPRGASWKEVRLNWAASGWDTPHRCLSRGGALVENTLAVGFILNLGRGPLCVGHGRFFERRVDRAEAWRGLTLLPGALLQGEQALRQKAGYAAGRRGRTGSPGPPPLRPLFIHIGLPGRGHTGPSNTVFGRKPVRLGSFYLLILQT